MSDIRTEVVADPSEEKLHVRRVQDVQPILEDAKARASAGLVGSKDYWHMAELPFVIVEKYCNDQGITFNEFMRNTEHIKRMVNDPALAAFRVHGGRM